MQTCPKSSRSAIISETVRPIEILRASYALQLLILSAGAHFQPKFQRICPGFFLILKMGIFDDLFRKMTMLMQLCQALILKPNTPPSPNFMCEVFGILMTTTTT